MWCRGVCGVTGVAGYGTVDPVRVYELDGEVAAQRGEVHGETLTNFMSQVCVCVCEPCVCACVCEPCVYM